MIQFFQTALKIVQNKDLHVISTWGNWWVQYITYFKTKIY